MRTVGAYEAKTHLGQLLEEVAKGDTICITKRGETVAMLVPPSEVTYRDAARAKEEWRAYRRQHRIVLGPDLTIRALIEEGRRE